MRQAIQIRPGDEVRIRTVKPELFLHDRLFEAERSSGLPLRLAFIGIWCAADRAGRFKWEPRRIGAAILPYDGIDFSRVMDELEAGGWLVRYEVDGKTYGEVPSFTTHQLINNRESRSVIPENPSKIDACPTRAPRVPHAPSDAGRDADSDAPSDAASGEGKGREGERKEEATARARELVKVWNAAVAGTPIATAAETYQTLNKVSRFLGSYPEAFEDFRDAAAFVKGDDFFQGRGRTHFVAHLDYLLKDGKAGELAAKHRALTAARPRIHMLSPDAVS